MEFHSNTFFRREIVKIFRRLLFFFTCSVCSLFLFSELYSGLILYNSNYRVADLNYVPDVSKSLHPKIDGSLAKIINSYNYGNRTTPLLELKFRESIIEDGLVSVVIETEVCSGINGFLLDRNPLKHSIQMLGGNVIAVSDNFIEAQVPLSQLFTLADFHSIRYIHSPLIPEPHAYISEGVELIGAGIWKNLSPYRISNREVKVAILDSGFNGYESLRGSELPNDVVVKSFRPDNDINAYQIHGTACAEIIHDIAPDAKLYLVNYSGIASMRNAVEYLIDEGIDIISYSMGWFNAGAGNGTGPICEIVRKATDKGILWVCSSGDSAEDHWEGYYRDSDADDWLNFSGTDEILQFYVPSNTIVTAYLNWNDWGEWNGNFYGGSSQDFDLYLYYWTGNQWQFVDKSENLQSGSQWPVEAIDGWWSTRHAWWGISIRKSNASRNCKHELFIKGNSLPIEYNIPGGSLGIPADDPTAIATGASDCSNDSLHSYSSQGPTSDLRVKPDFCAPSGVTTATYGEKSFFGTSASAPHLAGALALILTKTGYSPEQAVRLIKARALDLGDPGKDCKYGEGRIDLR